MSSLNSEWDLKFQKGIVDSLFGAQIPLLVGTINCVVAALLCLGSSQDKAFGVLAALFLSVGIVRLIMRRKYVAAESDELTFENLRFWRVCCILSGTMMALLLGMFCFYAIVFADDSFSKLASISVALANSVGIAARNFGSRRFVAAQSISVGIPLAAGLLLVGTWQEMILGALFGTYVLAIIPMATSLRNVLHNAMHKERDVSRIARELGVAMEIMPNGLMMFDEKKQLKVSNSEARKVLGFVDTDESEHPTARQIFKSTIEQFDLNQEMSESIEKRFQNMKSTDAPLELTLHKPDGRIYRFVMKAGGDGNLVMRIDDITAEETANAKIASMARYDTLTGLSQRGWFFDQASLQIEELPADSSSLLAVIDLDNFKTINDTHGHPAGDAILTNVAMRLQRQFGSTGICGRLGGDEFVLFIPLQDASPVITKNVARQIGDSVKGTYKFLDLKLDVDASVGVACGSGTDVSVDELISNADFALYEAKRSLGTNVLVFEDDMQQTMSRQKQLIIELKKAIAEETLYCAFQPIVSTSKCRVTGYEALCRWKHDELGQISPAEFIPIAEDLGLISQITARQLHVACLACVKLPGDVSVSVNLSAIDFRSREILETIKSALSKSGLKSTRLTVEVTETSLLDLKPETLELVDDIRALGVKVALDDFGVGYSSLSYLNKLQLDRLKIDRSFVTEMEDSEKTIKVISAIAHLAKEVDMELVIEGVETTEQLETICSQVEVDLFQGFLFGAPLEESVIVEFTNRTFPRLETKAQAETLTA